MRKKRLFHHRNSVRQSQPLGLENLEARNLLAGNVLASVVDGTLTIVGDGADNTVQVSSISHAFWGDGFRVEGGDNGGPTSINGYSYEDFYGVTNLSIDLAGGDDDLAITNDLDRLLRCLGETEPAPELSSISISPVVVDGFVLVKMGDGHNRVAIGSADIGSALWIHGGVNHDEVGLCEVETGANLVVQTRGGFDEVFVHECHSGGATRVLTANGDSEVEIDGLWAEDLIVRGGYHEDDILLSCIFIEDDVVVQTGYGFDWVTVEGCSIEKDVALQAVPVERSEIGDVLLIQTADGGTDIDVRDLNAGRINVVGGINRDHVNFEMVSTMYGINVNTLDGSDDVDAVNVVALSMVVYTGPGHDGVFVGGRDGYKSHFHDDLIIGTDGGDDHVQIGSKGYIQTQTNTDSKLDIGDDLVVDLGDGTDFAEVVGYNVGDNATVDAGPGDDSGHRMTDAEGFVWSWGGGVNIYGLDVHGNLNVLLGDGADSASVEEVYVYRNMLVDAGAGDDGAAKDEWESWSYGDRGVHVDDITVKGNFSLFLGDGSDDADICDIDVYGNAYIYGGPGSDDVVIEDTWIDGNLYVFMGGADDDLHIDYTSAENAWLYGGGGTGDFYSSFMNSFGSEHVFDFEIVVA